MTSTTRSPSSPSRYDGSPGTDTGSFQELACLPSPCPLPSLPYHTASIGHSLCSLVAGHLTDGRPQLGAFSLVGSRLGVAGETVCGLLVKTQSFPPKHMRKMAPLPGGLSPGNHPGNQGGRSEQERRRTGWGVTGSLWGAPAPSPYPARALLGGRFIYELVLCGTWQAA